MIERPFTRSEARARRLDPRATLRSVRAWVFAAARGGDARAAACAETPAAAACALDVLMRALSVYGRRPIDILPVCCSETTADEARLLAAIAHAGQGADPSLCLSPFIVRRGLKSAVRAAQAVARSDADATDILTPYRGRASG
ncbi:MAG: hypothetical protein ACFB2Z_03345 [Maricaulaceae bacterium]